MWSQGVLQKLVAGTQTKKGKAKMLSSFNSSESFKMKCRGELNGYQTMKNQRKIAENIINPKF